MQDVLFIKDLAVVLTIAGVVGWICRRLQLSAVVGYLVAGIIIGPYTPLVLVSDLARVHTLAQLGLVFLIFSVGLGFSFGRMQRLGLPIVLATAIGAFLVLSGARLFAAAVGWSPTQGLFLAGTLMVSSSAIIAKVLEELGESHERFGQLALGVTVLEDVVAVVMLTLLTSIVELGGPQGGAGLVPTLWRMGAFIVLLLLSALLFVPKLVRSGTGSGELRTLLLVGIVLSAAWAATLAGYSMALSAFVLGVVVAGTRDRPEIERAFESFKQVFGAVFFVAIGMLVDVSLIPAAWPMILAVTLLALVARPLACAIGLMAVGNTDRESLRAGLVLTPIGEFSLIMAQIGVESGAMPSSFQAVAVGVCLCTSLAAPVLTRFSHPVSSAITARAPRFHREGLAFYHDWLSRLYGHQARIWKLIGPLLGRLALYLFAMSALLLLARPVHAALERRLGGGWAFPGGLRVWFLIALGVLLIAPLVALWRTSGRLADELASSATAASPRRDTLRPLVRAALRGVVVLLLLLWLLGLLPLTGFTGQQVLFVGLAIAVAALGLAPRLQRWHDRVEQELGLQLRSASSTAQAAGLSLAILEQPEEWQLEIDEVVLPTHGAHAGRPIKEIALRKRTGVSIVGIDRQGLVLTNPSADERLFPGDRLLLLGTSEQLATAERLLMDSAPAKVAPPSFAELTNETVRVPETSAHGGQTLAELDLIRRFGVQVVGIRRGPDRRILPSGEDVVLPGDQLLLLGTIDRIERCRTWFERDPPS